MTMYCVKCHTRRDPKSGTEEKITLKNGRPATKAVCSVCGTNMFRIGA